MELSNTIGSNALVKCDKADGKTKQLLGPLGRILGISHIISRIYQRPTLSTLKLVLVVCCPYLARNTVDR